jgi:hypothetical protein
LAARDYPLELWIGDRLFPSRQHALANRFARALPATLAAARAGMDRGFRLAGRVDSAGLGNLGHPAKAVLLFK